MAQEHDPEATAIGLAEKLAPRNRHVVFLLGAGASCAAGLPDTAALQEQVADQLPPDLRLHYERIGQDRNLEEVLSRLRLISEVLGGTDQEIDGLGENVSTRLDRKICRILPEVVRISEQGSEVHRRFAAWIRSSSYEHPIEVFTTNYDLLIEDSLEAESVPYFDGFVGAYDARFRADLVDGTGERTDSQPPSGWTRVWKLHGSVSWKRVDEANGSVVVRSGKELPNEALAIFPSHKKYEESRRFPFVVLADRLRRALEIPETVCVVVGYSFGDEHVNHLLFDAARFHPSSEVIALFYEGLPQKVAGVASRVPNLTLLGPGESVIGAIRGNWKNQSEDSLFWEENEFSLGNFESLANFLFLSSSHPNEEHLEE